MWFSKAKEEIKAQFYKVCQILHMGSPSSMSWGGFVIMRTMNPVLKGDRLFASLAHCLASNLLQIFFSGSKTAFVDSLSFSDFNSYLEVDTDRFICIL